ncbi:MAG: hypothetical protein ILP07_11185 [Treponema sp.]|nr:hypothetical protein [Treponema sp.]
MNPQNNFNNLKHTVGTKLNNMSSCGYMLLFVGVLLGLVLFGRLILFLAIIGGIGWLVWKLRWTLLYCFERIRLAVEQHEANCRQKCQQISRQNNSSTYSNPFQTSAQYQPGSGSSSRNSGIFDVKPGKGSHS